MIGAPTAARPNRARIWLLLKMYCAAPRETSAPSVPPQQVVVVPLVLESPAFPPDPRSSSGRFSPFWLGVVTVMTAEPEAPGSACDMACTVTVVVLLLCCGVELTGTALGAVYSPPELIAPVLDAPPVTPLTCHVTAVLGDPFTIAVNCTVPKTRTLTLLGVTLIEVLAAVMVTLAEALLVGSADDTAVTVTVAGFGNCAGAV